MIETSMDTSVTASSSTPAIDPQITFRKIQ